MFELFILVILVFCIRICWGCYKKLVKPVKKRRKKSHNRNFLCNTYRRDGNSGMDFNKISSYNTKTMYLGMCYLTNENQVVYLDGIFPHKNEIKLFNVKKNGKLGKKRIVEMDKLREWLQKGEWKLIGNLKPITEIWIGDGKIKKRTRVEYV